MFTRDRAYLLLMLFILPGILFAAPPLEVRTPAEARDKVLAAAEKYLGVPYRYSGVDLRGLDCSGLIHLSFMDALGLATPRTVGALYRWVEKIPDGSLQKGDLVFFNISGSLSHVGIYAGEGRFIHSASVGPKTGVIYSRMDEGSWRRNYVGGGRALPPGDW